MPFALGELSVWSKSGAASAFSMRLVSYDIVTDYKYIYKLADFQQVRAQAFASDARQTVAGLSRRPKTSEL